MPAEPIQIRSMGEKDFEGHRYQDSAVPLPLRLIDMKPKETADRGLNVLLAFASVYFAKSDAQVTEVRSINAQANQDLVHTLGYNGMAELVLDTNAFYLVTKLLYLATYHIRCQIRSAIWDVTAYYVVDQNRELEDPLKCVETAFDHDNRIWRAPTLNGVIAPCDLHVRRVEDDDVPVEILMERFPMIEGKRAVDHLCLFDNIPEAPPEESEEKPTGIIDPRTGRAFGMD